MLGSVEARGPMGEGAVLRTGAQALALQWHGILYSPDPSGSKE